jgi:hypothetical protein
LMGITSGISVASVLLKQKQKKHIKTWKDIVFQTKKNMQGDQEIFNPRFTLKFSPGSAHWTFSALPQCFMFPWDALWLLYDP